MNLLKQLRGLFYKPTIKELSVKEQFESLFPMNVEVTQQIIDEGRKNLYSGRKCTGALTVKRGLRDMVNHEGFTNVLWGRHSGYVELKNDNTFVIESFINKQPIDMMEVTEPFTITFKLDRS